MKCCKFCGEIIPKSCKICPKCLAKQPNNDVVKYIIIGVVVFLFLIGAIFGSDEENTDTSNSQTPSNQEQSINQNSSQLEETEDNNNENNVTISEEEYKNLCKEYNYKDVLRNPENYIGEKIVITVKISSVHEKSWSNPTKYYFAYSESVPDSGYYLGDRYGIFDERENADLKLLKDDVIKVYGEIADTEQTQSMIVMSEEIFCINMKYVELLEE